MDVDLVLPGHGDPITDHRQLIDQRFALHRRRADKIRRPDPGAPAHRLSARSGAVGKHRRDPGLPDALRGAGPRGPADERRRVREVEPGRVSLFEAGVAALAGNGSMNQGGLVSTRIERGPVLLPPCLAKLRAASLANPVKEEQTTPAVVGRPDRVEAVVTAGHPTNERSAGASFPHSYEYRSRRTRRVEQLRRAAGSALLVPRCSWWSWSRRRQPHPGVATLRTALAAIATTSARPLHSGRVTPKNAPLAPDLAGSDARLPLGALLTPFTAVRRAGWTRGRLEDVLSSQRRRPAGEGAGPGIAELIRP